MDLIGEIVRGLGLVAAGVILIAVLIGATALIGLFLPKAKSSAGSFFISLDPPQLFKRIEALHEVLRQAAKPTENFAEVLESIPPRKLVTRLRLRATETTKVYELTPEGGGSSLTIFETVRALNPCARFFSHFFHDAVKSAEIELVALGVPANKSLKPTNPA